MKCAGVDLMPLEHNGTVMIAPLTSRGQVGKCDIEVPLESLPALIEHLQSLL